MRGFRCQTRVGGYRDSEQEAGGGHVLGYKWPPLHTAVSCCCGQGDNRQYTTITIYAQAPQDEDSTNRIAVVSMGTNTVSRLRQPPAKLDALPTISFVCDLSLTFISSSYLTTSFGRLS